MAEAERRLDVALRVLSRAAGGEVIGMVAQEGSSSNLPAA